MKWSNISNIVRFNLTISKVPDKHVLFDLRGLEHSRVHIFKADSAFSICIIEWLPPQSVVRG